MIPLTDHPRFPFTMHEDVRHVIVDEVRITLSGYLERRPHATFEAAVTAYAEQLESFLPDEIQEGFKLARYEAQTSAPVPTQVRQCVEVVCRTRQAKVVGEKPFRVGKMPAALRRFYQEKLDTVPGYAEPRKSR